jgi:hypothetical protein
VTTLRARWKLVVLAVVVLAAAGVILSVSAWSSSESGTPDAAANDTEQAMLDFAQCMRDNGVPSFPDPVPHADGGFGFQRPEGVPETALDDALQRCEAEAQAIGIGPGSGAQDPEVQDGLLDFSRCMRENGIPEFPDPKPGSDLISGLHALFDGIDQQAPRAQQAIQSCQPILAQLFGPAHGGG